MSIFLILLILLDITVVPIYLIIAFFYFFKRRHWTVEIDKNMLNTARIIMFICTIAIAIVSKNMPNLKDYFPLLITFLIILFIAGFRLLSLSNIIKEENPNTFYYKYDQWLIKIYRKYLEPLWDKKE
jgi:hypothetical protein